jgi:hypothetical protein
MDFRAIVSAELPPARDDEPDSLRQDIADELGDHLLCAYKRELLRGAEPGAARASVLSKFGDPAVLGRRLWIDAMRGKIMVQRILIATCLVVALSSIAFVGIAWSRMSREEHLRSRATLEALEAARRVSQALAESQATNQEMLKRLEAMSKAVQSPQTPDWIPVTFKLTRGCLDGPPAVGCQAHLGRATGSRFMGAMGGGGGGGLGGMGMGLGGGGAAGAVQWTDAIHRLGDENGLVDFGVVQPGDWEFSITSGNEGSSRRWLVTGSLNVLPGTKVQKPIICPSEDPERAQVRIRVAWPDDLAPLGCMIETRLTYEGVTFQPQLKWFTNANGLHFSDILFGMRGAVVRYTPIWQLGWSPSLYFWHFTRPINVEKLTKDQREIYGTGAADPAHVFAYLAEWRQNEGGFQRAGPRPASHLDTFKLDPGMYRVQRIAVLRPRARERPPGETPDASGEWFDLLAHAAANRMLWTAIASLDAPPDFANGWDPQNAQRGQNESLAEAAWALKRVTLPAGFWRGNETSFEVHSGTANEWVLHLPNALIEAVRKESGAGKLRAQNTGEK